MLTCKGDVRLNNVCEMYFECVYLYVSKNVTVFTSMYMSVSGYVDLYVFLYIKVFWYVGVLREMIFFPICGYRLKGKSL